MCLAQPLILWNDCWHPMAPVQHWGCVCAEPHNTCIKAQGGFGEQFLCPALCSCVPRTSARSGSELHRELLIHGSFAALTRAQLHSGFTWGRVSVIPQSSAAAAVLQELGLSSDCCNLGPAASQGRTCHPFPLKSFQFPASLCTADDYLAKALLYIFFPCVVQIILS